MISYIVIGRNEGWKLALCLARVVETVRKNRFIPAEIIYVDSNSTDDSVERAKRFHGVQIIKLTRLFNSAIARNVGADRSKGDMLFFIDGDMEIESDFIGKCVSPNGEWVHPFISGQVVNLNYDKKGEFLSETLMYPNVEKGDTFFSTSGGILLVDRILWFQTGGMDVRFKRCQDHDFALRLAKKGILLLRKKDVICRHHTIAYTHSDRLWTTLVSGDVAYSGSFLIRKHIFNKYIVPKLFQTHYTTLALIVFLGGVLLGKSGLLFIPYLLVVSIKVLKNSKKEWPRNFELLLFYVTRDLFTLFYFFVPIPKIRTENIETVRVQQVSP
jgi:glycosyltransferase involved in cell wall biosynthesis